MIVGDEHVFDDNGEMGTRNGESIWLIRKWWGVKSDFESLSISRKCLWFLVKLKRKKEKLYETIIEAEHELYMWGKLKDALMDKYFPRVLWI